MSRTNPSPRRWIPALAVALAFVGLATTQATAAFASTDTQQPGTQTTADGPSTGNCCVDWPW